MTFLWLEETGKVSPMRTPIRISSKGTRYYCRSEHFCQHCGAEHLDPVPPVERMTWQIRTRWMLQGAAILAVLLWSLFGVVVS